MQFEDLEIWKQSRELCKDIYKITNYELFNKDFRFRDQIRASSGSIMDNIAEGFERNGNKELTQFCTLQKALVEKREANYTGHLTITTSLKKSFIHFIIKHFNYQNPYQILSNI
jgi:four helix bundle protein